MRPTRVQSRVLLRLRFGRWQGGSSFTLIMSLCLNFEVFSKTWISDLWTSLWFYNLAQEQTQGYESSLIKTFEILGKVHALCNTAHVDLAPCARTLQYLPPREITFSINQVNPSIFSSQTPSSRRWRQAAEMWELPRLWPSTLNSMPGGKLLSGGTDDFILI